MLKVNARSRIRCPNQRGNGAGSTRLKKNKGSRLKEEIKALMKSNKQVTQKETKKIPYSPLKILVFYNDKEKGGRS